MVKRGSSAILVLWAGRHRRDLWTEVGERYIERIRHRVGFEEKPIRVGGSAKSPGRIEAEGKALLAAVPERAYCVALDSRGTQRTSTAWARWLGGLLEGPRRPLVFLVGSDLGLSPEVGKKADETVSFGAPTLPHELARVVLFEQLYRGLSILGGMKYHREPL